jgi:ribosome recycling factor
MTDLEHTKMDNIDRKEKRKKYLKEYRKTYSKRRVSITLSEEEYQNFVELSHKKEGGIKPTTLASNLVKSYINEESFINDNLKSEFQEMKFLLRNIANNLNQAVRAYNRSNKISRLFQNREIEQLQESRSEIKKLYNSLDDYLKAKQDDYQKQKPKR